MRSRGHVVRTSILLLTIAMFWRVPVSGAAFATTTVDTANSATTLVVAAPVSANVNLSFNIIPLLTCRATISWSASTTPGVTKYEVVRVNKSTGTVSGGPWIVTALSGVDSPLPLLGNSYEWRVRSILGTNWRSGWKVATVSNALLC